MSNPSEVEEKALKVISAAESREERFFYLRMAGVAALGVLLWTRDQFLPFGHPWGKVEVTLFACTTALIPWYWTRSSKRRAANEIRDRRAIRIEMLTKSSVEQQEKILELLRTQRTEAQQAQSDLSRKLLDLRS